MHDHDSPDGEPDLQLGALRLWVHERQYPEQSDWDAGWLVASAICESKHGRVTVLKDPFLHADELRRWLDELLRLQSRAGERARLCCNDKVLAISLAAPKGQTGLTLSIELRPDLDTETHHYTARVESDVLGELITTLRFLLASHEPPDGWPQAV